MAQTDTDMRAVLGLLAAIIVAPLVVALTGTLLFARGKLLLWTLETTALATLIAAPFSALVVFFFGVPAILLARWLRIRSVWYYLGSGLVGAVAGMLVWPGEIVLGIVPYYAAGGLAASLVYWLIAERRRPKDFDADL